MKKYALVLSGGGFRGAFQVGALNYLKKHWHLIDGGSPNMKFDIIAGVSVGTLNGAMMASGKQEILEDIWLSIARNGVKEVFDSDILDLDDSDEHTGFKIRHTELLKKFVPGLRSEFNIWRTLGFLISRKRKEIILDNLLRFAGEEVKTNFKNFKSIADNKVLKNKIKENLKLEFISDCVLLCGLVSLNDGKYYSVKHHEFDSDEDYQKGVLASSSMPIIWEPIDQINTARHTILNAVDGGIRNISPIGDVIDLIALDEEEHDYTIIIINCNSGENSYIPFDNSNIATIAIRSLNEIAISEIFNNDIEQYLRLNDIVRQTKAYHPLQTLFQYDVKTGKRTNQSLRHFNTILIQPIPGILGDSLYSSQNLCFRRIAHGKQKAEEAVCRFLKEKQFNC